MQGLAVGLGICALAALARSGEPVEIVVARGPDGAAAALSNRDGLVVVAPGGERLVLGAGHAARFDAAGALVFDRAPDDGHFVGPARTWILEPGATRPRPLRPGEATPALRPSPVPPAAPLPGSPVRVAVDPGHGGSDPGAIGFGLEEADVVLDVALRLADLLALDTQDTSAGGTWEVLMTRIDDSTVSLAQRVDLANAWGADTYCSIHANAFTSPAANGTETYAWAEGTTAAALRDRVQAEMLAAWSLNDRGVKTAGFYVLLNTVMPATLSETGFITSPVDVVKLDDPNERHRAALAHLHALQAHHGFGVHDPTPPPLAYCTAGTTANGCTARMGSVGTPSASAASGFELCVDGVEGGRLGILFYGVAGPTAAPWGAGTSFLCVRPPTQRTGARFSGGTPGACDGVLAIDWLAWVAAHPGALGAPFDAGRTVWAQGWFRDPPSAKTTSLSDGLSFVLRP